MKPEAYEEMEYYFRYFDFVELCGAITELYDITGAILYRFQSAFPIGNFAIHLEASNDNAFSAC